eukprot:2513399-Amphidinium_carterae.3
MNMVHDGVTVTLAIVLASVDLRLHGPLKDHGSAVSLERDCVCDAKGTAADQSGKMAPSLVAAASVCEPRFGSVLHSRSCLIPHKSYEL